MYKIVIDAGHGGSDSGAVSGGLIEKNMNLQCALAMGNFLKKYVDVTYTRNSDIYESLAQKTKDINASGADIGISIHWNAGRGDGFEAFSYNLYGDGFKVAKFIEKQVLAIGQNTRGVKDGSKYYLVRNTSMPFVLLEGGFIDNQADRSAFDSASEIERFGIAYGKGILDYLGIGYSNTNDTFYRVQVGAYLERSNAENMLKKLESDGYDGFITEG